MTTDFKLPKDGSRAQWKQHGLWSNVGVGEDPGSATPLTVWPWISCLTSPHLYSVDIILVIELLREKEMMPENQLANCLACSGVLTNR